MPLSGLHGDLAPVVSESVPAADTTIDHYGQDIAMAIKLSIDLSDATFAEMAAVIGYAHQLGVDPDEKLTFEGTVLTIEFDGDLQPDDLYGYGYLEAVKKVFYYKRKSELNGKRIYTKKGLI